MATAPTCKCPSGCKTEVGYYRAFGSSLRRARDICDACGVVGCTRNRIAAQCPEVRRRLLKKPGGKLGVQRVQAHGQSHGSASEADRYGDLILLEKAGAIRDLKPHPSYQLYVPGRDGSEVFICNWKLDSEYIAVDPVLARLAGQEVGSLVTEDSKHLLITDEFRFKQRVFFAATGRHVYVHHHRSKGRNAWREPKLHRVR